MEIISITSSSNSLLKRMRLIQSRSGREKEGCFLIEGVKLFDEAVKHGVDIQDVVITESLLASGFAAGQYRDVLDKVIVVEDKLMSGLATTETPQGLIATAGFKRSQFDDLFAGAAPLVVIGDRVQDPGNLGTIMRTALAFGASGLVLTKGSVDAFNPKVVRAAAGALFTLPFVENVSIEEAVKQCRERGLAILALSADGTKQLHDVDLKNPTALLLGNEANGLEQSVEQDADLVVSIPMAEKSESLNVAIANAVVLYEASSQRRKLSIQ